MENEDAKSRIKKAIEIYSNREREKWEPKTKIKSYGKPEKKVEKECLVYMRSLGWSVNIFEAKATWNPDAGAWTQQGMKAGTCDCLGNTPNGVSIAVEFKAPGSLASFNSESRYLQKQFIIDKINTYCFAVVVDSAEMLKTYFREWSRLVSFDRDMAKEYLMNSLPQMREKTRLKRNKLFDEE